MPVQVLRQAFFHEPEVREHAHSTRNDHGRDEPIFWHCSKLWITVKISSAGTAGSPCLNSAVFALFLISFLSLVIGNAGNAWERLGDTGRSDGETLAKFQEHPAYVAMYERFPGAVEKVEYREDGGGSIEVGAMNFENNGQLVLHMYYIYSNDVHAEVTCMNDAMDRQTHVDDLFAESFIRNTDCLDTVGDAGT